MAIFTGGYKACLDVYKSIKSDKSIVYLENNIEKEVENIDIEAAKPLINKEKTGDKIENGFNYKNQQQNVYNVYEEKTLKSKENKNIDVSNENAVAVFKVNKNQIVNEYTTLEKLELLSILKLRINEEDYKTIENLLYSNEKDIDILKKINNILKKNLDKKDYDKILNLASRVVNVELVIEK